MIKILLSILCLVPSLTFASENIANFDDKNISVLNDELRLLNTNVNGAQASVSTIKGYFTNGILESSHGGTSANLSSCVAGDIPVFSSTGVMTCGQGGPSGIIVMWSGTIATIPSGWVLCDGSNGTPDLRNRFIVGADADSGGVAKTTVTGSATQSGDGQIPAHTHSYYTSAITSGAGYPSVIPDGSSPDSEHTTSSYGTGTKNIAVYYALAFIMKT